jgi:hypothetical protein
MQMNNTKGIRTFFEYLPESIKFHKLKNEGLAKLIFLITLVFQLAGDLINYNLVKGISIDDFDSLYNSLLFGSNEVSVDTAENFIITMLISVAISVLTILVCNIFYSVYTYSYIAELKGRDSGFKASFKGTFKNFGRILIYYIFFGIAIFTGMMFFIIPAIVLYIMFAFGICYILDLNFRSLDAMAASATITAGKKVQIFGVFIGFFLLIVLPQFLIISGNALASAFIASFIGTIGSLVFQRLIVLMYRDLEYNNENQRKEKSL